jgi:rare lipoprotein A
VALQQGGGAIIQREMIVRVRPVVMRAAVAAAVCALIGACTAGNESLKPAEFSTVVPKQPPAPAASEERLALADLMPVSTEGSAVASDAARQQLLEPDATGYDQTGMASWYGGQFHGRETADGEIFDRSLLTAAHLSLPMPSYVRVTNIENDRSIVLRVNDRGPYSHDRLIDVSEQAAEMLAFRRNGSTKVRVQYVSRAPRSGDDMAMLLASYRGPSLPVSDALAFAQPEQSPILGTGAAHALKRITEGATAKERILMAFDVADRVEE